MLLFAPAKFATAFTFASLMWLGGFALLWGPRATLLPLLAPGKRLFSAAYFGSLALSLYAALAGQGYFLVRARGGRGGGAAACLRVPGPPAEASFAFAPCYLARPPDRQTDRPDEAGT